jgi:NAD(P)-dependent dehydrogenase (short-subunit alcohol dehydrogenase family)
MNTYPWPFVPKSLTFSTTTNFSSMNVKHRYALITGTSSGIGRETSKVLIEHGWIVIGTVRANEDAKILRMELGENFYPIVLDVCSPVEIHAGAAKHISDILQGNPLDGLVHNAGIALGGPLIFQPETEFRAIFETNVQGVFKLTQAVFPFLTKGSRMVMISSVSGRVVTPFIGAYAASKFALEALTDAYRNELDMLGMKVISIQPGPVKTPIWGKARQPIEKYPQTQYRELLQQQDKLIDVTEQNALPVSDIAALVLRALEDSNPATRYLAVRNPWNIRLAGLLPDKLRDKLVMSRLRNMKKPGA